MKIRPVIWMSLFALTALCLNVAGEPPIVPQASKQAQIVVGPNIQVSKAYEKQAHAEVLIAADRKHPARLLAASIFYLQQGQSVIAYRSSDNGTTWQPATEKRAIPGGSWFGDPAVAFGPDGTAYFASMRRLATDRWGLDISFSRDGGETWLASTLEPGKTDLRDRPHLVADHSRSRFSGRVYCNLFLGPGIGLHESRNQGKTFAAPSSVSIQNCRPGCHVGPGVVLSDGVLVIPYAVRVWSGDDRRISLRLTRSPDGGASLLDEEMVLVHDYPLQMPMLAVDPGSKDFQDRLYLVWSEKTPAGTDVKCISSKDKGVSWSQPLVLNESSEPKEGPHDVFLPNVAVNQAGIVAVAWYDWARDQEGKPRCHFRLRASLDGGQTWLPSVRVSNVASTYELRHAVEEQADWVGDTAGLAADAAGVFHPLWIDNRTGVRQVFTASVTIKPIRP